MNEHQRHRLREDVELRQRNTIWPDTVRNAAKVDGFLWKGSPTATKVQRVGAFICGMGLVLIACAFVGLVLTSPFEWASMVLMAISSGIAYVGFRLLRNAFLH